MTEKPHREIDAISGIQTTAHEWDGVKELDNPLPKWWLYTFYACILWSIGYMIVYPAWPTLNGYTKGIWGYSQRVAVADEMKTALGSQSAYRAKLEQTPLADVRKDGELLRFAMAGGGAAFQTNCAPCHGRGAQGFAGYPNLNDDDWVWGGSIAQIEATIQHGIRSPDDKQTRDSAMPKFGLDNLLKDSEIDDAAEFVLSLSAKSTISSGDPTVIERGAKVFTEQCASCHGDRGQGKQDLGAPNLTDGIWLYGGQKAQVVESIRTGRGGMMPAWSTRLDAANSRRRRIGISVDEILWCQRCHDLLHAGALL